MESLLRDGVTSSTSILYSMFPPPDGVEFTFFCDELSVAHICLCDVAGKSFVGKGATRKDAHDNSARRAVEGLGLALVQSPQGNEVVNIADEKRRLEFMVRDLKTDIINAETRHEAELKLYKDTIQTLREEATIMKSDLIKMRDEKEMMTLENEKMKSYIATKDHFEFGDVAAESVLESHKNSDSWKNRKKVQFPLTAKKSQGELKIENEQLNDKIASLELEKKALQKDLKRIDEKYCDKFANNNLPDQDKVYKLQKAEIERLKQKNKNLVQLKTENKLKIFNLEVKSKAYDDMLAHNAFMKEETKKLQDNYSRYDQSYRLYDKLESQHKMCTVKDNDILSKDSDVKIPRKDDNFKKAKMSKLVAELMAQVKELEENNSDVMESMKKLSDVH